MSDSNDRAADESQSTASSEDGEAARAGAATEAPSPQSEAETTDRAEEYLRLAQRAQADLVNYRRRVDQEREEIRSAAKVDAAMTLLPVLDDFERAISAIPEDARQLPWVQGILLIERNLRTMIERAGLERIDAAGKPFDPWEHEAVMTEESAEREENTVTSVFRAGYRAGGRVVRPAQVAVSRRPADS